MDMDGFLEASKIVAFHMIFFQKIFNVNHSSHIPFSTLTSNLPPLNPSCPWFPFILLYHCVLSTFSWMTSVVAH